MGDEKGKNYCSLGIAVFCKIGVIEMCKPFLFIPKKMFTKMIKYHLSIIITCLLYTSDAADDMQCVDLGGRRIIKKRFSVWGP